ncbi:MAG: YggS family pyridoxal phosphate-dependent enzyme [Terriglobales bacterium]
MGIAENVARVRERMAAAASRARRDPDEITLMAVTKTFPPERILDGYDAGLRVFGENRVQEFAGKIDAVRHLAGTEFHLIGHLQTNKAARAAEIFSAVDSLDSLRLARKLDEAAAKLGKRLRVLIEVNVGGEEQKSGVPPCSPELEELLQAAPLLEHLQIRGLMTIPPYTENPQDARPYFRMLRELRDDLRRRRLPRVGLDVLSMGMSHDFEVAIEEGSTCIRVGTAIFGPRSPV